MINWVVYFFGAFGLLFFAITFYLHTGEGACRKRSYSPSGSTGYVIWKFRNTWDRIKKQKLLEQPLSIAFLGDEGVLWFVLLVQIGCTDRGSVSDQGAGDKVPVIQFVPVITAAVYMIACGVD